MSEPGHEERRKVPGVDLEEDLAFQRATWRVQRVGWLVLCGILASALLGLLGNGPLSSRRIEQGSFAVEAPWIARASSEQRLDLAFDATDPNTTVWLERTLLDRATIVRVVPQPLEQSVTPSRLNLRLATTPGRVRVRIELRPDGPSLLDFELGVDGSSSVHVREVVLP